MLRGVVGVLSGVVLLGLAQATIYQAGKTKVRDLILDQTLPRDVVAQFMVNTIGLEETLAFIVDDLHPPVRLDAVTTLVDAKAEGKTLHTSLRLSGIMKLFSIPRDDLKSGLCAVPLNVPLLRAGATLRFTYDDADDRELARLALTADECGLSSSASPWSKLSAMSFSLPKPPAEGAAGTPMQAPLQAKASDLARGPVQETLATRLIVQDNWLIRLVGLGFAVLGGAVSALLFVSASRMARPTYVLGNGVILVLAVLAEAALIPVSGVIESGAIGARVLTWAFVQFACGFALWRLAAARSRDALGHSLAGALAFIPLANLWLMLAPPREEPAGIVRPKRAGALHGGAFVLAGVGLVAFAWLLAQEADRRMRVAIVEDEALPAGYRMRYLVNNDGLERTLEYLSHLTVSSEKINGRLVLQKVNASGTVLTRTVRFSGAELASPVMQSRTARKNICADEGYVALLEAGATIRESYRGKFNLELGSVAMTAGDCRG